MQKKPLACSYMLTGMCAAAHPSRDVSLPDLRAYILEASKVKLGSLVQVSRTNTFKPSENACFSKKSSERASKQASKQTSKQASKQARRAGRQAGKQASKETTTTSFHATPQRVKAQRRHLPCSPAKSPHACYAEKNLSVSCAAQSVEQRSPGRWWMSSSV